jgi:disulfide bond formation protein DsbB
MKYNNIMRVSIFTILQFIRKDNFRLLHIGIISISVFALAFAYYVEYVMELAPCPLCIYQRFPYLALIKVSITALIIKKLSKYTLFFIVLNLFIAVLLAGYHSGVEREIFKPSSLCSSLVHIPEKLSIQEIKKMFYNKPIATCTKPALVVFCLSMTEWNLLLNIGLLFGVLIVWLGKREDAET